MRTAFRELHVEQLERRDCPTVSSPVIPPIISADLSKLAADLNTASTDFLNKAPVRTEVTAAAAVLADTAKLALDVQAATHARLGGALAPLIHLEFDEATLYFDFATGNTAGAKNAATHELNDLNQLGNALTGTRNPGLSAAAFSQATTAFTNANNTLFGIGGSGGGGGGSGGGGGGGSGVSA
jgi:hypothetical protein